MYCLISVLKKNIFSRLVKWEEGVDQNPLLALEDGIEKGIKKEIGIEKEIERGNDIGGKDQGIDHETGKEDVIPLIGMVEGDFHVLEVDPSPKKKEVISLYFQKDQ